VLSNKSAWTDKIKDALGPDYVCLHSISLVATHLVVFVHKFLLPFIKNLKVSQCATGIMNRIGNKGGIGIGFNVGETSLLFVCCHLSSGQSKFKWRTEDFLTLERTLMFEEMKSPSESTLDYWVSDKYDAVIWVGDLNFWINLGLDTVFLNLKKGNYEVLLANDQLI